MSSPRIQRSQRRSRLNGSSQSVCLTVQGCIIYETTHIAKNFDQNNFRSLTVATKPQHYHRQKKLPFLLSCWQHFAGILPLSQWLCRKSTTWFMSRRMRRHFSPVNMTSKLKRKFYCIFWQYLNWTIIFADFNTFTWYSFADQLFYRSDVLRHIRLWSFAVNVHS